MYELTREDVRSRFEELAEEQQKERYKRTLDNIIRSIIDNRKVDHVIYTGDSEKIPPMTWGKVVNELSVSVEFEANSPNIDDEYHIIVPIDDCQFFSYN